MRHLVFLHTAPWVARHGAPTRTGDCSVPRRLDDSGQRRQLLGYHECRDGRWGPLRDRMQLLLQLQDGEFAMAGGGDCKHCPNRAEG